MDYNFIQLLMSVCVVVIPSNGSYLCKAEENKFGCDVQIDTEFHGLFVNCSKRLTSIKNLNELENIQKITHLDISHNKFKHLGDGVFERFTNLTWLDCKSCLLTKLDVEALRGLHNLQILNLENNYLPLIEYKFPKGFFKNVPRLKELYIGTNGNYQESDNAYSHFIDIFETSKEITHLSIDSFANFRIGKDFLNLTKLYFLRIHFNDNTKIILNDSLKEFQNSSISVFGITGGDRWSPMHEVGVDVFQYLPENVSDLFIHGTRLGNNIAVRMLKPLGGRTINTISFAALYTPVLGPWQSKNQDITLTKEELTYLGNISLTNFYWFHCGVYISEPFIPETWKKTLKSLVVQTDAVIGTDVSMFFKALMVEKLEIIAFLALTSPYTNDFIIQHSNVKQTHHSNNARYLHYNEELLYSHNQIEQPEKIHSGQLTDIKTFTEWKLTDVPDLDPKIHNRQEANKTDFVDKCLNGSLLFDINQIYKEKLQDEIADKWVDFELMTRSMNLKKHHASWVLSCPPNLTSVVLDAVHYIEIKYRFCFKSCPLKTIVITNILDQLYLSGSVYGLDNLQTVNLKATKIAAGMNLDFFDTLPSIRNLVLSQISPSPKFYQDNAQRIIKKLINLEYFDLSECRLSVLPSNLFISNKHIKHVKLNRNKFSAIPFKLKHTPELEILDLQDNVFTSLTFEERQAIDDHTDKVQNFKIMFDGNRLSCTCSDFDFIAWLQSNLHHFDNNGNYSCTSEGGVKSYTDSFSDVAAYWRQCQGQSSFLMSLILACALVAVYLGIFVGMKKKTEIISQLRQWVLPGFKMKTRGDFCLDVCIGYARQDGVYVRNIILKYLEGQWRLRTFVHERDLLQDPLKMNDALRDCWRCLLLITENFLYDDPMAHNIMKVSTFFVSPTHPRKVIVMVEESVLHQIPDYVLQAVDEDNIIVLPSLECDLNYEAIETLKSRILRS